MLGDRDREKLQEIERALENLSDRDYGLCEECGEPIGENRLMALPFTRLCVDCKSRNERAGKVGGRPFEEAPPLGIIEKSEDDEEF